MDDVKWDIHWSPDQAGRAEGKVTANCQSNASRKDVVRGSLCKVEDLMDFIYSQDGPGDKPRQALRKHRMSLINICQTVKPHQRSGDWTLQTVIAYRKSQE